MVVASQSEAARPGLGRMLTARTVAIVGATDRPGSLGNRVVTELVDGGFDGSWFPVTPTRRRVRGVDTVPSLAELDTAPDLTILAVADHRMAGQLTDAVGVGTGGVVVFSPCVEPGLRIRLGAIARESGTPVCGPNGMGFVNVEDRLRATGYFHPIDLRAGGVTFLSHSGSLFSAMLHNRRDLRFNLVVSSGVETVTTMDEYLDYAIDLASTRAIGLFLETIRRPDAMRRALSRAAERRIPVVALKVGRSSHGARAAATHSGALAGEDAVYEALFDLHGVHRVDTMDEMVDTLELFASGVGARAGGLGAVLDSGGERTLLIDIADSLGVPLAVIGEPTRARLREILDPGLEPENPVDAWGTGHGFDDTFEQAIEVLSADPAVGVMAFCLDLTAEADQDEGYLDLLVRVGTRHRLAVVVNLASGMDLETARRVRAAGIPVLEGTATGLSAIGHLLAAAAPEVDDGAIEPTDPAVVEHWRARLATSRPIGTSEGLGLLADYGIVTAEHRIVASVDEAVRAAHALGGRLVLKADHLDHKTEVGGVALGLDTDTIAAAYREMSARLGSTLMVQAMVAGVEMALGVVRDAQFGPLTLVAAGGVDVERIRDRRLVMGPVSPVRAAAALDRLRIRPLLDAGRDRAASSLDTIVSAAVAMGRIAADLGDLIEGLDVNPLMAGPDGAVAVDALVVPRQRTPGQSTASNAT